MKLRTALAALALSVLAPMMSNAQAQTSWTGCYLGAQAGYGATHHETSIDVAGLGQLATIPLSSQGGAIGLHAGCDVQIDRIVIGAFGDYNWLRQSAAIESPLLGGQIAKLALDTMWTVGGRVGITHDSSLFYVLAGYSRMEADDLAILNASFNVPTFDGWTFGGGIGHALTESIRLSAEYRYTRFDKVDVALIPNVLSAGFQPDMHAVTARLSYQIPVGSLLK